MKNLVLFIIAWVPFLVSAQPYEREAGLRGGLSAGISFRQYLHEQLSYEALLSFRNTGMQLTVLRQVHQYALEDFFDNMFFVHGFGAHAGYNFTDRYRSSLGRDVYYSYRRISPLIGVDGYAGIEYRFESIPLSIGLDYKPFFEFSFYQFFRLQIWDFAFSAKYRF
jgi:hypothetical protein